METGAAPTASESGMTRMFNGEVRLEPVGVDDVLAVWRPDWHADAACKGLGPTFFSPSPYSIDAAKAVCADCPVKLKCRRDALDRGELYGVWGGLDPNELQRVRRKRRRQAWRDKTRGL